MPEPLEQQAPSTVTVPSGKTYTDTNSGTKINNAPHSPEHDNSSIHAQSSGSAEPLASTGPPGEKPSTKEEPQPTHSIPTPEYTKEDPTAIKEEVLQEQDPKDAVLKRRDSETPAQDDATPKPKRSRKMQGAGVKKPLYSRYEALFIIKAYKALSEKYPNLVLIDIFKIVAVLFNDEAERQGFKDRTPDQLYQKYKRIQHGLNHGETEFVKYFKQNKHNPKDWIPDFTDAEDDQILQYIKFPKLDEAANKILGFTTSNLKPPLHDLYDDDDAEADDGAENCDPEDELLQLAGYEVSAQASIPPSSLSNATIAQLNTRVVYLEDQLKRRDELIEVLKEGNQHKDTEIAFLKGMLKEDLSYIRLKLQEAERK